jgi:hypothetical protein
MPHLHFFYATFSVPGVTFSKRSPKQIGAPSAPPWLTHHERDRGFDWSLLFEFDDHLKSDENRETVLSFLCLGIRRGFRVDQFEGMREPVSCFCSARAAPLQEHPSPLFDVYRRLFRQSVQLSLMFRKLWNRVTFERECHAGVSFDSNISSVFCFHRDRSIEERIRAFADFAHLANHSQSGSVNGIVPI